MMDNCEDNLQLLYNRNSDIYINTNLNISIGDSFQPKSLISVRLKTVSRTFTEGANYTNNSSSVCRMPQDKSTMNINKMLEELSVFYVAITRARKQVYLSFCTQKFDNSGNIRDAQISCFPCLDGLKLVKT